MAINFPLSLDSLSNPSSGNKLDNPSHSTQHGDANDILEALETKLGIGASPAGSATAGFPLVHSSGGTTAWAQVGYQGITSGTATSGQVLTAGTATGSSIWSTPAAGGLILINTTSFSTSSAVSLPNNTFTSSYNGYFFTFNIVGSTALNITGKLRSGGVDNSSTIYGSTSWSGSSSVAASGGASATSWSALGQAYDADMKRNIVSMTLFNPQVSTRFTYGHTIFLSDINATPFPVQTYIGTNVTTSFDSITFGTNTGTITGSISCYGFSQ
jgi:hypothetical protein